MLIYTYKFLIWGFYLEEIPDYNIYINARVNSDMLSD